MDAQLMPGMPHHGGLVFARAAKGTEFSAELRRFFPTMIGSYRAMAAVTGSPLVRAAVNLMVRFTPASAETFRMFGSEAEALAWLDARAED